MCGRFTLKTPAATIASLFPELTVPVLNPRYNVAPTQQVACVRENDSAKKEIVSLRWGLVPFWAKDLKIGSKMINARSETVDTKPSFRNAFKKRRCLVIADGYFEWKREGTEKQPYYMTSNGPNGAFCMAGLWESWKDKQANRTIETCTVLTTDSNPSLANIHDRMPVVINTQDVDCWLDSSFNSAEKLKSLCIPADDDYFAAIPVNKIVNNARNDEPACVQPI